MRCELAVTRRGLAAAAVLAGLLLPAPVAVAKTAPKPENPTALPVPAIPGVPALPGAEAPPATLSSNVRPLNVIPLEGVTGTPMTISGLRPAGQQAGHDHVVDRKVTWEVDPRVDTVNYLGLAPGRKLNVVLTTADHGRQRLVQRDAEGARTTSAASMRSTRSSKGSRWRSVAS